MAEQALDDLAHIWSEDLRLGPTGDIGRVQRRDRSKERVLRRLMTNPGEYLFDRDYGAGLPRLVGSLKDLAKIKALIEGQMVREPSVSKNPAPTAVVRSIPDGVQVSVQYLFLPDKQPVSLTFDVTDAA